MRTARPTTGAAFASLEFLHRAFQAALVVASEPRALDKSAGVLCTGAGLLSFFIIILGRNAEPRNTLGVRHAP
jgi:hypothetical protein